MGATHREIKAAYRSLARQLHPDVGSSMSSEVEFIKLQAAYLILSDADKRADYDRHMFRTAAAFKFTAYSSRRWETDQCW